MTDYSAADVVKHARARLRVVDAVLAAWAARFPDGSVVPVREVADLVRAQIGSVGVDLDEHLSAFGGDPMRYDDGSPVSAAVGLTDDQRFVWVFDPRPDHPANRPHVAYEGAVLVDGSVVDLLVSGARTLDVVRRSPPGGR